MSDKRQFNFRCDEDVDRILTRESRILGISKARLINEIVRKYVETYKADSVKGEPPEQPSAV